MISRQGLCSSSHIAGRSVLPKVPSLRDPWVNGPTPRCTYVLPRCKPLASTSQSSIDESDSIKVQPPQSLKQSLQVKEQVPVKFEALVGWVGAAIAFGAGIWYVEGSEKAQEYFAGYLLEQSLSVDNLFVFILVFNYFKTPPALQPKVLNYGIATAAVLRAIMIILGVELIMEFKPMLAVFAAILLYSSYQILSDQKDDDDDLSDNFVVKWCSSIVKTAPDYDGDKFFTVMNGARVATPLLLSLMVIEISDVVFAVDSIPAVFGVTLDPFIIYTSNLFAILSLRSLYGFVSSMMSELRFLDKAVAVVLGFIGMKMLGGLADFEIPTSVSLLFVGTTLGAGVAASLMIPEPEETDSR